LHFYSLRIATTHALSFFWAVLPIGIVIAIHGMKHLSSHEEIMTTALRSAQTIQFLGRYYPYKTGLQDAYSRMVLRLKDGFSDALLYFEPLLKAALPNDHVLVIVPSHDPAVVNSPVRKLVQRVCRSNITLTDATRCVKRTCLRPKLSRGGDRSVAGHLNSLSIADAYLIRGRKVIIIDDVSTTGNSIKAVSQLVLGAGAASVRAITLAQTTYQA
jgi:predicted amidophosphoribosyltransferase